MIYKLFNFLKSVSVEGKHGVEQLVHDAPYYRNDHLCLEVKEVSHNEIQLKIIQSDEEIQRVFLDFMNPMENVKACLNSDGTLVPIEDESTQYKQCYIHSDWGTYALGLEREYANDGAFVVDSHYIHVELNVTDTSSCYRLLFEKYQPIYQNQDIIHRFNHQLGYAIANY